MQTNDLIRRLVAEASPVRPLMPWWQRFSLWTGTSLLLVVIDILVVGARPDLGTRWSSLAFDLDGAAIALLCLFSALACFQTSIPGGKRPAVLFGAWGALGLWLLLLGYQSFHDDSLSSLGQGVVGLDCAGSILGLSAVPVILGWYLVRRAAPLEPGLTGALAVAAATAAAALGLQFVCPSNHPLHALVSHLLPLVLLTAVGCWGSRYLVDPDRRRE